MNKKYLLSVFAYLICISGLYGQGVINPAVPSPMVGGIIQNDRIPVNLYNGLPEIAIPLYEIKMKSYTLD